MLGDMGDGMPFRPGTFDAVIRYGVNKLNKPRNQNI